MIKNLNLLLIICFSLVRILCLAQNHFGPSNHNKFNSDDILFIENKGQVYDQYFHARPDILFSGISGDLVFHLKKNGVSYQLNQFTETQKNSANLENNTSASNQTISYRIDLNWLNTNPSSTIISENKVAGTTNYYLEHCPDGISDVSTYQTVLFNELYQGISLKWHNTGNQLKYDYLCNPGSDFHQIQLEIFGAKSISINSLGQLLVETPLGMIIEEAPEVFQDGRLLSSRWIVKENIISFEIDMLDPSKSYIIDPIVRNWGTYYGGTAYDHGYDCAVDTNGFVYLAGTAQSLTSIATIGSYQQTYANNMDLYLVKFDSLGVRQWATYYGGPVTEDIPVIALDQTGNIYIAGETNSSSAISTAGSHKPTYGGGGDGFLAKFNATGLRLWGTYYGGSSSDAVKGCYTDNFGNVYISGYTYSTLGIATPGSHQTTFGGDVDGFLAKFNGSGIRQWGTYYGGPGTDSGYECSMDINNNIILTGQSNSVVGISTVGSFQEVNAGGYDAFIVQFNSVGTRQWGSYFGGPNNDYGLNCRSSSNGIYYLSGQTGSSTGIATLGAYQEIYGGGSTDAFLASFANSGNQLLWATYFGGPANDNTRCFLDDSDNVFLVGVTSSTSGIATAGSYQEIYGGSQDGLLAKFNYIGNLIWSTYYGGPSTDAFIHGLSDGQGHFYISGSSSSNSVVATISAHQPNNNGSSDGLLVKFSHCPDQPIIPIGPTGICAGSTSTYTVPLDAGVLSYTWITPSGWIGNSTTNSITLTTNDTLGNIQVIVNGICGSTLPSTLAVSVNQPNNSAQSITICHGEILNVDDHNYTLSGLYIDTLTNLSGCDSIVTTVLTVEPPITITTTLSGATIYSDSVFDAYQWIDCSNGNAPIPSATLSNFSPTQNGSYALIATQGSCSDTSQCQTIVVTCESQQTVTICFGETWSVGNNVYNSTGTFVDTLIGVNSCDSIVTTVLTVEPPITITTTLSGATIYSDSVFDAYQWIDCSNGNAPIPSATLSNFSPTQNGNYALIAAQGICNDTSQCQTIIVTCETQQTVTLCNGETWSVGNHVYNSTGIFIDTLIGVNSCDSIVTTVLTVEPPITITTTLSGATIYSDSVFDAYQWIDCSNGNAPIPSATLSNFSPTQNGNYALIATQGICYDTSQCQTISVIGLSEQTNLSFWVFPNPVIDFLTIKASQKLTHQQISFTTIDGQSIALKSIMENDIIKIEMSDLTQGIYFLKVILESGEQIIPIIKI